MPACGERGWSIGQPRKSPAPAPRPKQGPTLTPVLGQGGAAEGLLLRPGLKSGLSLPVQPLCTGLPSCLCLRVPAPPGQTLEPRGLQQLWGCTVLRMGSIPGQIPARPGSKPEGCCHQGDPREGHHAHRVHCVHPWTCTHTHKWPYHCTCAPLCSATSVV